jgi:transcriptional regulator with GAF, ATPase, and Fis domain/tetratricopeptide (TPR) repeat protein
MASYVLLAEFHIMRAEYQKALQHIEYVRRWAQLTDNPKLEIIASRRLGDIYCQLGERLMAKRIFEGVISGFTRLGSFSSDKYEYMIKLGGLNAQDQNPDLAFSLFEEANLQIAGKSIEPDILLASDIEMAEAALISQRQDIAEGIINRIQTRDPMHLDLYKPQKVRWLIIKGILARQKGDYQDAVTNLEGSIALSSQMGIPLHLAKGLYELGKVYQLMQRLPEAQDAFHKGLKILVDILGNVPPDLRQTFRASSLFTQTQQSLLELQTAMTPEPRLAPIDQELLLTTRMEGILQGVLEARDVHSCQYLILEGALSLSGATRAALLLRQEMSPQGVPLLCIDVDNHPVEFVVASWIEMGPERLRSIPQGQIIEGLKGPLSILQDRFLYLRLTATDRLIGQLILEIGTRPSDPILGVLRSFIARASIILDRLHMIQGLKEQHERAQREAQVSLEQLRLKHTQFEARMIPLGIIGTSEPMQRVYELVERVSSLEIPVLLEGETGTGKELFARAIHFLSGRRFRPFCAINCAAITETLLDSELFGYVKGAFTGATRDHPGLFESAHQGTLFLDEIEEMSQGMQKKLLRTIEDGQIRRVGGTHSIHVDVRIIGATNKSLREAVKMGKFREDLFHRLNIVVINLPPLRERKTDIPLLVAHFLDKIRKERGIKIDVEPSALRRLTSYHWPGNIRELENMILRFAVWGKKLIQASDIEFEQEGDMIGLGSMHGRTLREITDLIIERVLKEEGWDIPSAAKRLGLAQSTLYYRLKRMGIKDKKDRKFQDL